MGYVLCPRCHTSLPIGPEQAGSVVACGQCGQQFMVPGAAAPAPAPQRAAPAAAPARPREPQGGFPQAPFGAAPAGGYSPGYTQGSQQRRPQEEDEPPSKGLSAGAIVGIIAAAVGIPVVLAIVAVIFISYSAYSTAKDFAENVEAGASGVDPVRDKAYVDGAKEVTIGALKGFSATSPTSVKVRRGAVSNEWIVSGKCKNKLGNSVPFEMTYRATGSKTRISWELTMAVIDEAVLHRKAEKS